MQGTLVQSLVQGDLTCLGAAQPGHHGYWAHALQQKKPPQWQARTLKLGPGPCSPQLEKDCTQNKDPVQPRLNKVFWVEVTFSTLVWDNDSLCCFLPKLCPAFCDHMDYSPPGSSYGISQARILEWVAIFSSRGSSWLRDWIYNSCIGRWILYYVSLAPSIAGLQFILDKIGQ